MNEVYHDKSNDKTISNRFNVGISATINTHCSSSSRKRKSAWSWFIYLLVSGTDPCKIGTVGPGGGWIFFVDYNDQYPGFTYLEAAPTGAVTSQWCSDTTTSIPAVAGWDANAVGRGRANTDAMLVVCTSGAANSADAYSTATTLSGDWFLPSEGEMMLMYTNLRQAGVGGFAIGYYWSSSENNRFSAWNQLFYNGNQNASNKNSTLRVRAVRAF